MQLLGWVCKTPQGLYKITCRNNEVIKVSGYTINIQKLIVFLYIRSELLEIKIQNVISTVTPRKREKYYEANRNMQDLYITKKQNKNKNKTDETEQRLMMEWR